MNISPKLRKFFHWLGSGLALISIFFVGSRLQSYWLELDLSNITNKDFVIIALLSIFYGAANLLLSISWWNLLQHLGANIKPIISIRIYGLSQLAKYLPGNIFHLAGRQALGLAENIPGWILLKSSFFELSLIAIAGSLFGWLVLPLISEGLLESLNLLLVIVSIALVAVILTYLFSTYVMRSFLYHTSFLIISGLIFVILLNLIVESKNISNNDLLIIGAAFIVAWLAGFLTPGSPAGLGVREVVLIFLLKYYVIESDLLITILISRIVTILGDVWFYLLVLSNSACQNEAKNRL